MNEETKKEILDMLLSLSYAYEKGDFWHEWSEMHKFISNYPTKEKEM